MIWAIVPVKPLLLGKSRLAGALPPQERASLNRNLLENTLRTLRSAEGIEETLVTSRDPEALAIARDIGARTLLEQAGAQLNGALERAMMARAVQCRAVLVLPADLPLLGLADVQAMLDLLNGDALVVIAPDRRETGTNALFLAPPACIPFHFGPDSFSAHCRAARSAGVRLEILRRPSLGLDLDVPEDFAALQEVRLGPSGDAGDGYGLPQEQQPASGEIT